jgi:nucleoside phosphorylase
MNPAQLHLVVALPAEARPLIRAFGLKRQQPDGPFPLYQQAGTRLVLSGVGSQAAAAATHFLHQAAGSPNGAIWINIGIAGHASRPIGEPILAQRLMDDSRSAAWETAIEFVPPCPTDLLTTLAQPEFDYRRPGAFDMEAAGFYTAACQLAPRARVHCLKVISDNGEHPGHGIGGRLVSELIDGQLETLSRLVKRLQADPLKESNPC